MVASTWPQRWPSNMEAKGPYFCEDASGSPSEMTNATRARSTLEGGSNCLKGKEDEVQTTKEAGAVSFA